MRKDNIINKILLILVAAIFLFLTIPSFISDKHYLYNLEPYPDALYYTISAKNLIQNGQLTFERNNLKVSVAQPPLYPSLLSFGYLAWNSPASFYLVNILLILSSILLITAIILQNSKSNFINVSAIIFLISHAFLYWLPSVAMTENLAILLISICLFFITKENFTQKHFFITISSAILLILTKISIVPTALLIISIGFYKIHKNLNREERKYYYLGILLIIILMNFLFTIFLNRSLMNSFIYFAKQTLSPNSEINFYDISNVGKNVITYSKTLFGQSSNFLWLKYPLTSLWIILSIITNLYFNKKLKNASLKLISLLLIFISQFFLLLSFHITDSRYIIYTVLLLPLIFIFSVPKKIGLKYKSIICIFIILHIVNQLPLFKLVISENIFHKSTAWQYEAILHFNKNLAENSELITTLPPFLVDAYQSKPYRTLPLSKSQEFLQKGELVWGEDVNYADLITGYKNWLVEGKTLYISNSYITHQQSVIDDFEMFKKEFNLELVSSGCLEACNIYKLGLK